MFEFMKTITLRAVYECQLPGNLPAYLGSTIRGVLGHCIREFCCLAPATKCFLCENRETCLYVRYFSNTGGESAAVNPYTIYVHSQGKEKWDKGDICVFDLTLFGRGAEQAGIYLDALLAAEQRGWGASRLTFKLVQVTDVYSSKLIYAGGKTWIRNLCPKPFQISERTASFASLTFDTPLRIVSGGNLFDTLPFEVLIQFLIRRISLLTEDNTDYKLRWNEEEILSEATKVKIKEEQWKQVPFKRYSMNQKNGKLELDSKTGWVLYEGDLTEFVPILEIGKYLRVGKGATIGFGHYEISYD